LEDGIDRHFISASRAKQVRIYAPIAAYAAALKPNGSAEAGAFGGRTMKDSRDAQ
jgi:hypothetical protein